MLPPDRFSSMQLPEGATIQQFQEAFRVMAVLVSLVMFLPALLLLYSGFGVRRGRGSALNITLIVLIAQATLLGSTTVLGVVGDVLMGASAGR